MKKNIYITRKVLIINITGTIQIIKYSRRFNILYGYHFNGVYFAINTTSVFSFRYEYIYLRYVKIISGKRMNNGIAL